MTAASSPCVKICVIDPASKLCQGCGRTLREIAQWAGMSEAQRLAVMALLPERMRAQRS
ncbi:DUF1289 domain-containing protein [Bosea sp. LjRoot9]|uniref:DUF1289 domain-containing protein n=1 Tax=Bosea sp. LjRoot9 TaxID=3342341 RepID=UPI003ECFFF96